MMVKVEPITVTARPVIAIVLRETMMSRVRQHAKTVKTMTGMDLLMLMIRCAGQAKGMMIKKRRLTTQS